MSCCSKLKDIVKKLVGSLRKVLVLVLLVAAVYFSWFAAPGMLTPLASLSWLPAGVATLSASGTVWGVAALGAALLIDGKAVGELVSDAANVIGEVSGKVVGGLTAGLVGGLTSSVLGMSPAVAIGLGLLLYFFVFSDDAKDNRGKVSDVFSKDEQPTTAVAQKAPA